MLRTILCFLLALSLVVTFHLGYIPTTYASSYIPITVEEYEPPQPTNGKPEQDAPGAGARDLK